MLLLVGENGEIYICVTSSFPFSLLMVVFVYAFCFLVERLKWGLELLCRLERGGR